MNVQIIGGRCMNGNKGDNEIATYCVSYSANPGGNAYGIPEFILA